MNNEDKYLADKFGRENHFMYLTVTSIISPAD